MTLLTICDALALDVGMAQPTQIIGAPDRQWSEAKRFSEEVGEELSRRVAWGQLTANTTLTGDGTNKTFDLPATYDRLAEGISVTAGGNILRPLSQGEWASLTASEGTPRYFLLQDNKITLWPYLATGETATVYYQSLAWCSNGTAAWTADDETSLIDEDLHAKALIVRWRRQKGMEFEDQEAEFEEMLRQVAGFDNGGRS